MEVIIATFLVLVAIAGGYWFEAGASAAQASLETPRREPPNHPMAEPSPKRPARG